MIENATTRVIDASTATRVAEGWTFGFPELTRVRQKLRRQTRSQSGMLVHLLHCLDPAAGGRRVGIARDTALPPGVSGYIAAADGKMISRLKTRMARTKTPFMAYGLAGRKHLAGDAGVQRAEPRAGVYAVRGPLSPKHVGGSAAALWSAAQRSRVRNCTRRRERTTRQKFVIVKPYSGRAARRPWKPRRQRHQLAGVVCVRQSEEWPGACWSRATITLGKARTMALQNAALMLDLTAVTDRGGCAVHRSNSLTGARSLNQFWLRESRWCRLSALLSVRFQPARSHHATRRPRHCANTNIGTSSIRIPSK